MPVGRDTDRDTATTREGHITTVKPRIQEKRKAEFRLDIKYKKKIMLRTK